MCSGNWAKLPGSNSLSKWFVFTNKIVDTTLSEKTFSVNGTGQGCRAGHSDHHLDFLICAHLRSPAEVQYWLGEKVIWDAIGVRESCYSLQL